MDSIEKYITASRQSSNSSDDHMLEDSSYIKVCGAWHGVNIPDFEIKSTNQLRYI
jgi:penicillin-binding protein-related factor A (putative recombinase)